MGALMLCSALSSRVLLPKGTQGILPGGTVSLAHCDRKQS